MGRPVVAYDRLAPVSAQRDRARRYAVCVYLTLFADHTSTRSKPAT
jgi:hypothetical protein